MKGEWKDQREKWIVLGVLSFVLGQVLTAISGLVALIWGLC